MVKKFGKGDFMLLSLHPLNRKGGASEERGWRSSLDVVEMKRGGVKVSCNDTPRKKFEKTLKKIWKGREKRFIFAPAFASRKGRG